jgi:hypothetical protein
MSLPNDLDFELSQEWAKISLLGLNQAYDEDEPKYSLDLIKEFNPEYERK